LIVIGVLLAASAGVVAQTEVQATLQDIHRTFGSVPTFFKAMPPDGLPGAWQTMKSLELSPATALDGKTKELIGLAVAAQIPCRYCVYFHTKAARMHGATDEELREATAMSAITLQWSTVFEGAQLDYPRFKQDVQAILRYTTQPHRNMAPIAVTDAPSAYRDIRQTLGMVPEFIRAYPPEAIAGAWREIKAVELSPSTTLTGKTKELIGLAVAAQMPCPYCIYFSTEAARRYGASQEEVREAVAMAGLTRHWSTMLNGAQVDETQFRREVDRVVRDMRRATARASR
jgi:AhpD family alkylhydroperoxidase